MAKSKTSTARKARNDNGGSRCVQRLVRPRKPRPITRKIVRLDDGAHTGWSLYIEDYERAITAMGDVIYDEVLTSGDAPVNCAIKALAAIGIQRPNDGDIR